MIFLYLNTPLDTGKLKINYKILEIESLKKLCQFIECELTDYDAVNKSLEILIEHYNILNATYELNGPLFRARKINSNPFNHVRELSAPPAEITPANRLNLANDPVMYLAQNMLSAFDEIHAKDNNIIQLMIYETELKYSPKVALIGEIKSVFRTGKAIYSDMIADHINQTLKEFILSEKSYFNSYVYTDSFINKILTDKDAKKKNYITTQSLFKLIRKKHPHINGIVYEGISSQGAKNLVITTNCSENFLIPKKSMIIKIVKSHGFGLYDYEVLNRSLYIKSNGNIVWEKINQPL